MLTKTINGVLFSFTDKICFSNLPSKGIANAIDGIKPDLKRMIKNEIF